MKSRRLICGALRLVANFRGVKGCVEPTAPCVCATVTERDAVELRFSRVDRTLSDRATTAAK